MHKISFNFSDEQVRAFDELATLKDQTFAETVRNALDEVMASRHRGRTLDGLPRPGVSVRLSGAQHLFYEGACAQETEGKLEVRRSGKVVARFQLSSLDYWFEAPSR